MDWKHEQLVQFFMLTFFFLLSFFLSFFLSFSQSLIQTRNSLLLPRGKGPLRRNAYEDATDHGRIIWHASHVPQFMKAPDCLTPKLWQRPPSLAGFEGSRWAPSIVGCFRSIIFAACQSPCRKFHAFLQGATCLPSPITNQPHLWGFNYMCNMFQRMHV